MNRLSEIGSESLQAAFLRDEIPAAMQWLRKEGFERVDADLLDRYLYMDRDLDLGRLDPLVDSGLLRQTPEGRYELTEAGSVHGDRVLTHHFADLEDRSIEFFCQCGCCGGPPELDEPVASQRVRASVAG